MMKVLGLFFFFSLILCIDWVNSQTINQNLLLLDCSGTVNILPDNKLLALKWDLGAFRSLYNIIHNNILHERLKCKCPSVSLEEFAGRFGITTVDYIFARLTGVEPTSVCGTNNPTWDIPNTLLKKMNDTFDLKTCTYQNWRDGNDCLLELNLPPYGIDLQVAVGHCPDKSLIPWVSISCAGDACDTVGLPCMDDNDCDFSQNCYNLGNTTDTNFFDAFKSARLYDNIDISPGCYPGSTFLKNVFNFIRETAYQKPKTYNFPQSPLLDFKLCSYPTDINAFGCTTEHPDNNTEIMSCTALKVWNGILADGSDVRSPDRINGKFPAPLTFDTVPSPFPSSDAVPIFYQSPANDILILPNGGYGLFGGFLTDYSILLDRITESSAFTVINIALMAVAGTSNMKLKNYITNLVSTLWYSEQYLWQSCRAGKRGFALSDDEFKIRFGWMLPSVINLLTNPSLKFDNNMSDWFVSLNTSSTFKRFNAPSTCSYAHYLKTRSISFKFTGFQSLIDSDITLNFLIKDTPGWNVPLIYMECSGKDCGLITLPRPCSDQPFCTSNYPGTKCMPLSNTKNMDFIQAYFTHKWIPVDSCGSPALVLADLQKLINSYTLSTQAAQSICFWDIQSLVNTVNITGWAQNQYVVDGDTFTIRDLSAWIPAGDLNIPGTVKANSISILVNWWVLFLFIFICWKL
jgi:hypothetical protein